MVNNGKKKKVKDNKKDEPKQETFDETLIKKALSLEKPKDNTTESKLFEYSQLCLKYIHNATIFSRGKKDSISKNEIKPFGDDDPIF
uniref:Uncharacterized protein n=1 Tax=Panagrolaimus sp. JU765 TaxID=591449 RepID=A0AC34QB96_9BILA